MRAEPFSLPYSEAAVEDLRLRLARTRWPDEIPGPGWTYGVDLTFIKLLCDYWKNEFDWKAQLAKLSKFHHYRCTLDGIGIHFIHFPKEAPFPPRAWIERGYNLQQWTEMPRGAHFAAAAEEPELLARDIATFFHSLPRTP